MVANSVHFNMDIAQQTDKIVVIIKSKRRIIWISLNL